MPKLLSPANLLADFPATRPPGDLAHLPAARGGQRSRSVHPLFENLHEAEPGATPRDSPLPTDWGQVSPTAR